MKCLLAAAVIFFTTVQTIAQTKSTTTQNQIWLAYLNQIRFSKHWGTWVDLHLRTREEFVTDLSTGIARVGISYYAGENTRLTAGYAYVNNYPTGETQTISQPEHRPWQQVQWSTKYAKLRTTQYIRLEERFRRKLQDASHLGEGHTFNYRVRYNFLVSAPLTKNAFQPGSLAFLFNDEVHINFGKQIVNNYFDQNRLFVGFGYQTNKTDNLQFGYMNQFVQTAAGNRYRSVNAIRIYYFHTLDLRRNQ